MLELDFAFFNLTEVTKTGLAYKRLFLDRLAPLFFPPRLKKIIKFPYLNACGGNIWLPLCIDNLNVVQREGRMRLAQKTSALLEEYHLSHMAVDRRLKNKAAEFCPAETLLYGDDFIKALSYVLIHALLSKYALQKIIVVGYIEGFSGYISSLARYGLPISIQSMFPVRYEILIHQLMYDQGQAISTSYLSPENWESEDLVIIFDDSVKAACGNKNKAVIVVLNDFSCRLAPELDREFLFNGLQPALYNAAPILESCLRAKAGKSYAGPESIKPDMQKQEFISLVNTGHELGLWDLFLDKVL